MSTNDRTTMNQGTGVDEALETGELLDTASKMPEISRFVAAVRAAGLEATVRSPDGKTFFAPLDSAVKSDLGDVGRLIVQGNQTEADLRTARELRTFNGQPLELRYEADGARIGGARIVRRDIACRNGYIQILDNVPA